MEGRTGWAKDITTKGKAAALPFAVCATSRLPLVQEGGEGEDAEDEGGEADDR